MKNILVENGNGKIIVVKRQDYLKEIAAANGDAATVNGQQISVKSAELYSNGTEALETVNNSITENELIVATVSSNPLAPPPVPVVGESLDIDIKNTNTAEVTITVGVLPPAALLKDGAEVPPGYLEAGSTIRVIKTAEGYVLATAATIAAAKATATKIELAAKADKSPATGNFTSADGKLISVSEGIVTSIV